MSHPKESARGRANYLQHIGAVSRPQACSECGKIGTTEKHHPDYSRPEQIIWLCRSCHAAKRRKHVTRGLSIAVSLIIITVLLCGCQFWKDWEAEAAAAGTTPGAQIQETLETGAAFLPSPWREIIIGAVGLGGIVYQTISKRRLQKKLLQG